MSQKRKLNLDVAEDVGEFEKLMKEFLTKRALYKSVFRGKGLEFDSYRDFASDDDAAMIDWRASLRANKLLMKQYIEERDLNIMILVDVSSSMLLGSGEKLKAEYAAEIAAAFAYLIINSGDRAGFIFFNNSVVSMEGPRGGGEQFSRIVEELSNPDIYSGVSNINKSISIALDYIEKNIDAVIIVSDFIKMNKDSLKIFSLFSSRFETIAVVVRDPLDKTLPKINKEVLIENPETGEQFLINPEIARKIYEKNASEQERVMGGVFLESGIDFIELLTTQKFPQPLAEFLRERVEKRNQ